MEIGNLVKKTSGNDTGEIGIVVEKVTNNIPKSQQDPVVILTVLVGTKLKNWYAKLVEVIDESSQAYKR